MPFGTDLLFDVVDVPDLVLAVEICEDVWVPIPPSTYATMAGATVVANLSGSNITIGKAGYRRQLCSAQSARTISAYVYVGAGVDESTTDLAWDGHAIIAENGNVLAESERFGREAALVSADVDLGRLVADRVRMTSFVDCMDDHRTALTYRRVTATLEPPVAAVRAAARRPPLPVRPR